MTEEQMYDLLVQNGMDPLQAKSKAVEYMQDPELVQTLLETSPTDQLADGGRVGMNTGGNPSYQEIVDKIMASYPEGTEQDIKRREPQLEALIQAFGPQLAATLGTPLNPMTGGTNVSGQKYGAYAPTSANQNALQQASINQALKQAGYDTLPASAFDATGQLKPGASLTGSGIGAYQQFLNQAGIDAAGASAAAKAGQGAGAAGIAQAQTMAGLMGGQALAGQNARHKRWLSFNSKLERRNRIRSRPQVLSNNARLPTRTCKTTITIRSWCRKRVRWIAVRGCTR